MKCHNFDSKKQIFPHYTILGLEIILTIKCLLFNGSIFLVIHEIMVYIIIDSNLDEMK